MKVKKAGNAIVVFMVIMIITLGGCKMKEPSEPSEDLSNTTTSASVKENEETQTNSEDSTETSATTTQTTNNTTVSTTTKNNSIVEEDPQHYLAVTDLAGGIKVLDLDAKDPTSSQAVVWEWKPTEAAGWKLALSRVPNGIDEIKLRYSEYYHKKVVIMTSSLDWAGIADYETGKCLWEAEVPYMPHAIEMLPNGDLIVGGSGGDDYMTEGCLMYYNITAGDNCTQTDRQLLSSAHGIVWDPEEKVLWATGWDHLVAFEIKGTKLLLVEGKGCRVSSYNVHDLSADYYDSDQLFITTGTEVYKFSKEENKLLVDYNFSDVLLSKGDVKGITSFSDGSVAYCIGTGINTSFDTDTFYLIRLQDDGVGIQTRYKVPNFTMYKIKNFSVDYQ